MYSMLKNAMQHSAHSMSVKLYILNTMYSMLKNAMQHSAHLLRQLERQERRAVIKIRRVHRLDQGLRVSWEVIVVAGNAGSVGSVCLALLALAGVVGIVGVVHGRGGYCRYCKDYVSSWALQR